MGGRERRKEGQKLPRLDLDGMDGWGSTGNKLEMDLLCYAKHILPGKNNLNDGN